MDRALFDGLAGGDECLRRDLSAEDAIAISLETSAAEDIDLDLLEIQQIKKATDTCGHGADGTLAADARGDPGAG